MNVLAPHGALCSEASSISACCRTNPIANGTATSTAAIVCDAVSATKNGKQKEKFQNCILS